MWNYNAEWETTDGIRKADVAVSPDGTTWETVLRDSLFRGADEVVLLTDRAFAGADTLATSYALSLAVEKLMRLEVPEKGRHLRVIIAEMGRIASHLVGMGAAAVEQRPFEPTVGVALDGVHRASDHRHRVGSEHLVDELAGRVPPVREERPVTQRHLEDRDLQPAHQGLPTGRRFGNDERREPCPGKGYDGRRALHQCDHGLPPASSCRTPSCPAYECVSAGWGWVLTVRERPFARRPDTIG